MVKIGGRYRHFKTGKEYIVTGIAKHSETLEDMVVYEPQYADSPAKLWVRPIVMFEEKVEWPKGSGNMVPRFELLG